MAITTDDIFKNAINSLERLYRYSNELISKVDLYHDDFKGFLELSYTANSNSAKLLIASQNLTRDVGSKIAIEMGKQIDLQQELTDCKVLGDAVRVEIKNIIDTHHMIEAYLDVDNDVRIRDKALSGTDLAAFKTALTAYKDKLESILPTDV